MSQPATPAADADLAGRTLGDFKLVRRLGRGAMAEVYLAEQQSLRRPVALKVLKTALAGDVNYVQRFQNEARAAASLVHANIVQIYEVGFAGGVHYIAQEYVQGQNLREWLQRHGPLDAKPAVAFMRQAAAALHKAAQAGIVHRDIKPENIMLSKSGEVKVADFGLARIAREDDVLHLTQVGITMGTPLYMSPEQVEGKTLDSRSDLYSFGVTCYHVLAGDPPFTGETALAVAVQHLNSQPRRLEELRPDLPPGLARIVHRMMEKKPAERYPSARELLSDLRALPIAADDEAELWSVGVDEQTADDLRTAGGLHTAVSRLDDVMKTSALVLRRRDAWWQRLVMIAAAAFIVGGLAAVVKAKRAPPLLAGTVAEQGRFDVPKQESARAQFLAAQMQLSDVEAWLLSVERHFPNDAYFTDRARQELARLYWKDNRLDEALRLFDRFADRLEEEYKAFGLAGQSLVLTKRDELERAAQVLGQLMPLRGKLDPRMSQELQYAIAANQQALREKGVLPTEGPASLVPQQATAQDQLYFAKMQLGEKEKEDSLIAVGLYFPQDAYYTTRAKEELAKFHLQLDREATAATIFNELATSDGGDRAARAFGLAGQALLAARRGDVPQVVKALEPLNSLGDALDPEMGEWLASALAPMEKRLPAGVMTPWRNRLPAQEVRPPGPGGTSAPAKP